MALPGDSGMPEQWAWRTQEPWPTAAHSLAWLLPPGQGCQGSQERPGSCHLGLCRPWHMTEAIGYEWAPCPITCSADRCEEPVQQPSKGPEAEAIPKRPIIINSPGRSSAKGLSLVCGPLNPETNWAPG